MRTMKVNKRLDLSTVRGRHKSQFHEYVAGVRKKPPSKRAVAAEIAAEQAAAEKEVAVKQVPAKKKVAAKKKK